MSNTTSLLLLHKRCQERTDLFEDLSWFVQTLLLRNVQQMLNCGEMLEWWWCFGCLCWILCNDFSFVVIILFKIALFREVILFACELFFASELSFTAELFLSMELFLSIELLFASEFLFTTELLSGLSLGSFHFSLKRLL